MKSEDPIWSFRCDLVFFLPEGMREKRLAWFFADDLVC